MNRPPPKDWVDRMARHPLRPTPPKGIAHLLGAVCTDCGLPMVKGTGDLIAGRCGNCNLAWEEAQTYPPAA